MTELERIEIISALTENVMATVGDFEITTYHSFLKSGASTEGYWDIILVPITKRIYFIPAIMKVIDELDIDLAVYTDVARPGCIVIH